MNELDICPIESTVKLLNRKWTILLIRDMFMGKRRFSEFKENKPNLSNNVLSDTLKSMEKNNLVLKISTENSTEYRLTERGRKLNRTLYELAAFGLDEMECRDETDMEIINMFKDYYADLLNVSD